MRNHTHKELGPTFRGVSPLFKCATGAAVLFKIFYYQKVKVVTIVTGANKGIGLETVRQLASNGFIVVLTARDGKRGLEAVEKLKESGLSGQVVFHQLDVANPATVASLCHGMTFSESSFRAALDLIASRTS
ncbi:hypothetical protein L3X38_013371 [Prunus dulcis]|uniref:NAD(P)-binding Rossmann-fold superfamily protein n=1 Tax=Prunus dulcis TaxID=3755 RepID=A0AAD4WLD9_PRUDU|nr:hypothetical protein L3X38_013371 [Prunus dulcis]